MIKRSYCSFLILQLESDPTQYHLINRQWLQFQNTKINSIALNLKPVWYKHIQFCFALQIYQVMKSPKVCKDLKQAQPKRYKFFLGSRERYILINSEFQSGNIQLVKQISQFQFRLACVHDGVETGHKFNSKSWFYFCVSGFPKNTKGKFFITKVQTLSSIYYVALQLNQSKYSKSYRPVFKSGDNGVWDRIPTEAQLVMRQEQLECVFQFTFKDETQKVYFAFTYPYTYSDNIRYLQSLNAQMSNLQIYFHKQIVIKSIEGRDIHLLTITSHDHKDQQKPQQQIFNQRLFPDKFRPNRFSKPVILISARVHPAETASSFTLNGLVNFLLSTIDLRAKLLRKMFVFMIIPMINVDGVFRGHFRMDTQGKNLNRYYIDPCPIKQPAIYAIKQLANHLTSENRLSFYFDLHAHNAKKGHFIYGNSINDFVEQVQSQVFCKLIALNNKDFQYKNCNFTQKHMKAKDKFEDLTKQGCGRVVMHRLAKIIHSYSVQCGIVSANVINQVPDVPNSSFSKEGFGLEAEQCEQVKQKKSKDNQNFFNPQGYRSLGKILMVSILDVFDKNPFNRVYNSSFKSLDMLRRMTAFQVFHQDERFRMFERFVFGKVKNINDLIKQVLNQKLHYKKLYNFYFFDDKQLKNIEWPQNIPGLSRPKNLSPVRQRKYKLKDNQNEYSESFKKTLLGAETQQPNHMLTQQQLKNDQQQYKSKSSETQNFEQLEQFNQAIEIFEEEGQSTIKEDRIQCPSQFSIKLIMEKESEQTMTNVIQYTNRNEKQARSKSLKEDYPQRKPIQVRSILNISQVFQNNSIVGPRSQIKNSIFHQLREQIRRKVQKQIQFSKNKCYKVRVQSKLVKNFRIYSPKKVVKQGREKLHTEPNLTEKMCLYTSKCSPSLKGSQQVAKSLLSISTIQHN